MSQTSQKNLAYKFSAFLYYSIYLICFASWIFFRDYYQRRFQYSGVDIAYLVFMSLPFLLPWVVAWGRKHVHYLETRSLRFVVLSFAAAWYLLPKLQAFLRAELPGRNIEVFNAGVEWYTTKHSLINYTTYYQDWKPNAVVIMHGVNDLFRSCVPSEFAMGPYQESWTHFYGPAIRGARPLTFEEFLIKPMLRPWINQFTSRPVEFPPGCFVSQFSFEANLKKLIRTIGDQGSRPVLVTEPSLYKERMSSQEIATLWMGRVLCNNVNQAVLEQYPSHGSLYQGMKQFSETVRKIASEQNVFLIDAEAQISKDLNNFVDDAHHTKLGARELAYYVGREFIRSNLIQ